MPDADIRTTEDSMLFELINPSDKYTIEAPDLETAALAICILGAGKYALHGIDNDEQVPIFLFGGHDKWFKENFDRTVTESLDHVDLDKIATCLDTISLASGTRSSLNDIGKHAHNLADALREKVKEESKS